MVFPVVERELLVAARRPGTYATRAVAACFGICALVWNITYYSTHDGTIAEQSRDLFGAFTVVAFIFCALIGVVTTADCISEEKREGTLGLLFLTDLKGRDIIFGKIVAGSVNVVYGLLAALPIAALAIVMGGVSLAQFVAVALLLLSTMALSLAIGVLVSTEQEDERRSMIYTIVLIFIFMVFPLGMCGGPMYALLECMNSLHLHRSIVRGIGISSSGFSFALSTVWTSILATLLVTSACFRVPPSDERRDPTEPPSPEPERQPGWNLWKPPKKFLEKHAYHWLALRSETRNSRVWLLVGSMLVIWFLCAQEMGLRRFDPESSFWVIRFTHGFLKLWVAIEITRRLSEDMRTNSIEFLISTPLNERGIITGQWRAIATQFGTPIIFAMILEGMALSKIYQFNDELYAVRYFNSIILLPLDVLALISCGMLFALVFKRRVRAILISLAIVLLSRILLLQAYDLFGPGAHLGPHVTTGNIRSHLELAFGCVIDLSAIAFANYYLLHHFRRFVAERYSTK